MKQRDAVTPFHLDLPESDLADLRRRLSNVRLPERETTSASDDAEDADWSQGTPRSYLSELAHHWANEYDWRRFEAEFNAHGPATTRIFDVDIVFLHVRSSRPDARPLVLTHGWPSSVIEPLAVAELLADPADLALPAFH